MLERAQVERIVLLIPNLEKLTRVNNWRATQKFSRIIRVTTYLTGMKSINHNYFENNRTYGLVLRMVTLKKAGEEPQSLSTLNEGVQQ
jgi:hypothetical protein